MGKGSTARSAGEVCARVHAAGIWDHVYALFGFPGETAAEAAETIEFLYGHRLDISSLGISNFSLGRGSAVACNPEKYAIARVDDGPETDYKLYFPYEVSHGLTYGEGEEWARRCADRVSPALEGDAVLNKIGHFYDKGGILPLYLHHYEKSDPDLRNIVTSKECGTEVRRQMNRQSVPSLKRLVSLQQISFDVTDIRQNIGGKAKVIQAGQYYILFNASTGGIRQLSGNAAEILDLCDGKRNIAQIDQLIAGKYRLSVAAVEADCLALLNVLAAAGYIAGSN